eukprot:1683489-Pyramimonas_sp.AAC.1
MSGLPRRSQGYGVNQLMFLQSGTQCDDPDHRAVHQYGQQRRRMGAPRNHVLVRLVEARLAA